jgi:drug/metabolite transporter (DMT)-like permease
MKTTQIEQLTTPKTAKPYIGLGLGVITTSTAAVLIRLAQADTHSMVIAAWRLTLATLILTPFVITTRRDELKRLAARDWFLLVLSGTFLAIHFATWISALAHTTVAAAVVLVSTNPIFAALASRILFREKFTRGLIFGLITSFCGSMLIGLGDAGNSTHQLIGDVLALIGGASGAAYMIIGKRMRPKMSLLAYVYPVYGTAAILLLASIPLLGLPMWPASSATWIWLFLMALGPQVIGHSLFNWSLKYLSAAYVTISLLAEPIGSSLLAWLFLNESPTMMTLLGGLLTLSGIGVASLSERRRR